METYDLFPVRCYTCNNVIGRYQVTYEELLREGVHPNEIMDRLGVKRYCCRMNMLSPSKILIEPTKPPPGSIAIAGQENRIQEEASRLRGAVEAIQITAAPTLPITGATESMLSEEGLRVGELPPVRTIPTEFELKPQAPAQISSWDMPQPRLGTIQAPGELDPSRRGITAGAINVDPNTQFRIIKSRPQLQLQPQLQIQPQVQIQQGLPTQMLEPIGSVPPQLPSPIQSGITATPTVPIPTTPVAGVQPSPIGVIEEIDTLENLGI